ncbi:MAG: tetratricopeptide repeat protein [Bacteroidota bacterium]|jgi:tetratricopeptide (TPR) repeat protein
MTARERSFVKTATAFLLLSFFIIPMYADADEITNKVTRTQDSLTAIVSRLYSEGNYQKVVECAVQNDSISSSSKLLYYYGMGCAALYNYPKAQEYFQIITRQDSQNVNYHFQFARLLLQSGFSDDAIVELKTCIALDSLYLPASFQLGLMYNSLKKDPEKEIEIFSFLVRQNPDDFLSLYYVGDALRRIGLSDSGIIYVQRSIDKNPRYFPSLVAMANYKNGKKDYAEAKEYYRSANTIRRRDKDVIFQIGECYRKLGFLPEAIQHYKEAIAIDSLTAVYFAQLGYAYYSRGSYDSSITAYEKAIELDNDNVQYYRNLALVFQKIDSVQGVVQTYNRGIAALHPENISYEYNSLAAYYFSKHLWRKAAETYSTVYDFNPKNVDALYWCGYSFMQVPEKKSARRSFERYLKIIENDSSKVQERKSAAHLIGILTGKKE